MTTIKTIKELENNMRTLEQYMFSDNIEEYNFFLNLIKRGTCFIVYENNDSLFFAPSRFVGYQSNSMTKHIQNKNKNGDITNVAINKLLKSDPVYNEKLENNYKMFCKKLSFFANGKGSFGKQRRFWVYSNSEDIKNRIIKLHLNDNSLDEDINKILNDKNKTITEKQSLIKTRIGQGDFRKSLIKYWGKCALTNCTKTEILKASHIKPWRFSNPTERLNQFNGILLAPNMDSLFDIGLISFSDDGHILISSNLSEEDLLTIGVNEKMRIDFDSRHLKFLRFHRERIFIK